MREVMQCEIERKEEEKINRISRNQPGPGRSRRRGKGLIGDSNTYVYMCTVRRSTSGKVAVGKGAGPGRVP